MAQDWFDQIQGRPATQRQAGGASPPTPLATTGADPNVSLDLTRKRQQIDAFEGDQANQDAAAARAAADFAQKQKQLAATGGLDVGAEQAKTTGFYQRAALSGRIFDSLGVGSESLVAKKRREAIGEDANNYMVEENRQRSMAFKRDFIGAILRYESGAAIPTDEFITQDRQYFPQPGESEQVARDKALLRKSAIEGLRASSGPGAVGADERVEALFKEFQVPAKKPKEEAQNDGEYTGYTKRSDGKFDVEFADGSHKILAKLPPLSVDITDDSLSPEEKDRGSSVWGDIDAAVRGAADTLTLGFADEIAAGANTLFGGGTMEENLAKERAIDQFDTENNTYARLGGQLAGGLALPVSSGASPLRLGAEAAGYGAAYGFGSGEDGVGNRLESAGKTAAIAGTGGYFGGKLLDKLSGIPARGTRDVNAAIEAGQGAGGKVARAKRFGIDLPLGASGRRGAAIADNTLSNMIGAATPMNDARIATTGQVTKAVDNVASTYGGGSDFTGMGEALQRGARDWISRFEKVSSEAYDRIPISPKAPATLPATQATLTSLNTRFQSNPELASALSNTRLSRYMDALGSDASKLSWEDLKAFRSRIGEEIGDQRFSDGTMKSDLRALYGALTDDMKATAAAQGPGALRAFERANDLYRKGQERIEGALTAILGDDGKKSAEAAATRLLSMAKAGKATSDIKRLADVRSSISGDEWGEVSSSLIRLLGQPRNSEGREFSAKTFINNFDDISPAAKNLIFSDRGRGDLRKNLDQFSEVIRDIDTRDALRNTSNTAPNQINSSLVKVLLTAPPNAAAAKLWTNPRFVQWATGAARMERGALKAGGAAAGNDVSRQLGLLDKVAVAQPAIAHDALALQHYLVQQLSGSPGRLAAEDGGNSKPVKSTASKD